MKKLSNTAKLSIFGGLAVVLGIVGICMSITTTMVPIYAETEEDKAPQEVLPQLKTDDKSTAITEAVSGIPSRITIPSLAIDLSVVKGYYNMKSGAWTLNSNKAQFAMPSTPANNTSGTTFIYGHDTKRVFNRLHGIKVGAEIKVSTENGYLFIYTFSDSVITNPLSVNEVTAPSAKPRLSLQTCYGPTSADRQIFHAYLTRVEKL